MQYYSITIKKLYFLILGWCTFYQAHAGFPRVGQAMPEFAFNHVIDYKEKKVSATSLLGKWYILDFWVMGCQPCIESFPTLSKMVQQFKGGVDIFSVAVGGKELEDYYAAIKKKRQLTIPMAFDIYWATEWQVNSFPHIFIVDDKGILRAITSETNPEKLAALMTSGRNEFREKEDYRDRNTNDIGRLYFVGGNGGNDSTFLFRSVLARATPDYGFSGIANLNHKGPGYDNLEYVSASNLKKGLFQMSGTSLLSLYNTAYFGQDVAFPGDSLYTEHVLWPSFKDNVLWPVLEVKDSSDFQVNYKTMQGLFTYSLSVPPEKANRAFVMRAMQLDLLKCFGYEAKIEKRPWPVWKMIVIDPQKAAALRSKGADPQTSSSNNTLTDLFNVGTETIIAMVANVHPPQVFVDQTNLHYKIDIRIDGSLKRLDLVRSALQLHGLDLVSDTQPMRVLVISDPTNHPAQQN